MTTLYVFCGTEFGIPGDDIKIKLLVFLNFNFIFWGLIRLEWPGRFEDGSIG